MFTHIKNERPAPRLQRLAASSRPSAPQTSLRRSPTLLLPLSRRRYPLSRRLFGFAAVVRHWHHQRNQRITTPVKDQHKEDLENITPTGPAPFPRHPRKPPRLPSAGAYTPKRRVSACTEGLLLRTKRTSVPAKQHFVSARHHVSTSPSDSVSSQPQRLPPRPATRPLQDSVLA